YGNPSIQKAVELLKEKKVEEVVLLPLYPQYSLAATESSIRKAREIIKELLPEAALKVIPHFYSSEGYLQAATEITREHLNKIVSRRDSIKPFRQSLKHFFLNH
ncbi:MAG: hypothetical protein EBX40_05450, partial [Gammaproteobacteria bacterium]|nr:hypothetical protein [Gammaproteobacteria bacterium]